MLEGQNSASPPRLSHERSFTGCETLFDWSGSSASFPGLLKVVKFFSSLLGFTVSANDALVGDFLGLKVGLLVGKLLGRLGLPETEIGESDDVLTGLSDGPSIGMVDGLRAGEMNGPLDGTFVGERDGSMLGKSDGPSRGGLDGPLEATSG